MEKPTNQRTQYKRNRSQDINTNLLLLGTSPSSSLSSLNALLIRLDLATLHGTHEPTARLPRPLELATRGLAEQMYLDEVAFEGALDGDDGLDDERVRVLEVEVHDAHHANAHELRLEEGAELLCVVGVDGCSNGLGLFGRTHGCWFNVLNDCHVCGVGVSLFDSRKVQLSGELRVRRARFNQPHLSFCLSAS
jgi:hypothetical protein